jgi:hypothetical protein
MTRLARKAIETRIKIGSCPFSGRMNRKSEACCSFDREKFFDRKALATLPVIDTVDLAKTSAS